MRKVDISEYGKRTGFLRTFTAGEGQVTALHFPSYPSMQHAFIKMLLIINANNLKTRQEILDNYENNELLQYMCNFKNTFNPYVDHYWSDLFRNDYISQYRDGKRILYSLSEKGKDVLYNTLKEEFNF
jgi:predicted transcriptional regulator